MSVTINLSLTEEEIQTLWDVTNVIGGSPTQSRRGNIDSIRDKIKTKGTKLRNCARAKDIQECSFITFEQLKLHTLAAAPIGVKLIVYKTEQLEYVKPGDVVRVYENMVGQRHILLTKPVHGAHLHVPTYDITFSDTRYSPV